MTTDESADETSGSFPDYFDTEELPAEIETLDFELDHDPAELIVDKRRLISFSGLKWLPGVAAMTFIGFCQYVYFQMDTYAQNPAYRPHYEMACSYLLCDIPDYSSLDELATRELIIRTHPEQEEALIVDVLLLNAADYRQVFPRLRLQFFNLDGQVLASRIFSVSEYLGGELRGLKYIPARTEVRLSLELVDPGDEATGYEMDVLMR